MNIAQVRRELAAAARGIDNLTCTGYVPDTVSEPHWYAGEVEIDVNNAFARGGYDKARVTCRVLVSRADDQAGQQLLDEYLSRTGDKSIRAALNTARGAPGEAALNGACDDFSIERIQGYRMYQVGEVQYFGAEIIVMVLGPGEGS